MKLYEEFKLWESMWDNTLTEAKADTQRLIDFAGEDLANRFINIKPKLKSPENDLYYWIKNKSVDELEQVVLKAENTQSRTSTKKDIADQGAELVCSSEHWNVYHITTFEASQKYGRDSKWCITGINNYGDRYWTSYTQQGVDFYFLITKHNYNPRGEDSKFALAIYPNNRCEVFDQQDSSIALESIPYIDEVDIPGIDLDELENSAYYCVDCDTPLSEDEYFLGPDGDILCDRCFEKSYFVCYNCDEVEYIDNAYSLPDGDKYDLVCKSCLIKLDCDFCDDCGEVFYNEDLTTNYWGDKYCKDCWQDYLTASKFGFVERFLLAVDNNSIKQFLYTENPEQEILQIINIWNLAKSQKERPLRLPPERVGNQVEIKLIEEAFMEIANAEGFKVTPDMFT